MLTIFLRTVIIYVLLIGSMRILGKRQLGELEISELITTILLSEIAAIPISDQNIPVIYAVIPLVTIMTFEIVVSLSLIKFPRLKSIFSSRPSVLIKDGMINQKELLKNRISSEELISELRLKNVTDYETVKYAILEENGLMTVIPKASEQPPTSRDMNVKVEDSGILHIIISNGKWNEHNLKLLSIEKKKIEKYISSKHVSVNNVFLLLADDSGGLKLVTTEGEK